MNVAVKNKTTGQWWNAPAQTWSKTYQEAPATLTSPGAASTNWTSSFTAPMDGGTFVIQASAVDGGGQHDPTPDTHSVLVAANGNPPDTTITSPVFRQVFHFPVNSITGRFDCDSPQPPCLITITGTATDTGGAHPGVQQVRVTVRNIEHSEYYCGPDPSNSEGGGCWSPTTVVNNATLASPERPPPPGRSPSRPTTIPTSTGSWPGRWTRTVSRTRSGPRSAASACVCRATIPAPSIEEDVM